MGDGDCGSGLERRRGRGEVNPIRGGGGMVGSLPAALRAVSPAFKPSRLTHTRLGLHTASDDRRGRDVDDLRLGDALDVTYQLQVFRQFLL